MDRGVVGRKIRELRLQQGLSGKLLASRLGLSPAAISKFERGQLRPTESFIDRVVKALKLSRYDATALRELGALFNSQFQRWNNSPEQLAFNQKLIGQREKNASSIRAYWNQIIPGLLQSEIYMRHVIRSFSSDFSSKTEKVVKARLHRQKILHYKDRTFVFVLGEAALRTCIHSLEVQVQQLKHIESIALTNPAIEIRILPFTRPITRIPMHHFIIYDERTVEIEVNKGQLDLWTEEDVQFHIEIMNYLVAVSLSPAQSREFIAETLRSLPSHL